MGTLFGRRKRDRHTEVELHSCFGFLLVAVNSLRWGTRVPGATVDVSLQLQPEQDGDGNLYADVFLDGVVVASVRNEASTDFDVPAGDHELKLELNGYRTVTKKIRVLDTIRQNVHFTLTSD